MERLSRWGIGPHIAAAALAYAAVTEVVTHRWLGAWHLRFARSTALTVFGCALLVGGVVMLVISTRSLSRAYGRDELVTSGVFGIVRHPIYSAWLVFIVPGLALLMGSWPMLLTPLVAYAAFKLLIHREDDYLRERFGQAYVDYRAQVSELIPKFWGGTCKDSRVLNGGEPQQTAEKRGESICKPSRLIRSLPLQFLFALWRCELS